MDSCISNNEFIKEFLLTSSSSKKYTYIKEQIHRFNLDVCTQSGIPLLCYVIKYKHGNKYLDLLKGGAWANIQDNNGKSAIVYAAELHDDKKIEKLLLYGAAVNKKSYSFFSMNHGKRSFLYATFSTQFCYICECHDHDLCNIPCINRHFGHFICVECYNMKHSFNQLSCPICSRALGSFM